MHSLHPGCCMGIFPSLTQKSRVPIYIVSETTHQSLFCNMFTHLHITMASANTNQGDPHSAFVSQGIVGIRCCLSNLHSLFCNMFAHLHSAMASASTKPGHQHICIWLTGNYQGQKLSVSCRRHFQVQFA